MAGPPPAPTSDSGATGILRDPRAVAAAVAVLVRTAAALQASARGLSASSLDGDYYLRWAADIASGDVLGRAGTLHGEPFLLNPLYAYVLAPLVGAFGRSPAAVVVIQTLLAGAAAALAADAARRFAGRAAAWIAGLATALSAALVHLDGKVAVSGLAAFLVAGAVWSLSPQEDASPPRRGHGPLAAGAWLGLSLLARPVALLALPFAAWLVVRRAPGKARAAALFAVPLAVCAGLSLARNLAVSGEPAVFTAANGLNLHLGNNAAARRTGVMTSDQIRFGPVSMHDDARLRVGWELHREPTRGEISSWFTRRALGDFAAAPGASAAWLVTKLRWFAGPSELASSYNLTTDRAAAPLLGLGAVPTWLLVALAAAACVVAARRRDLLLGPGAIVLAHAAACTLAYPLSHYRSPAIPALAVMAGAGVAGALGDASSRRRLAALSVAAAVALAGFAPPQVLDFPDASRLAEDAMDAFDRGDASSADALAARALAGDAADATALTLRLNVANREARYEDARGFALRIVGLRPWDLDARIDVALADTRLRRKEAALREATQAVDLFPWSGKARGWRGAIRTMNGDHADAADDLRFAQERGFTPPPWALSSGF